MNFIELTKIPDCNKIYVNAEMIERIQQDQDGSMITFQSGSTLQVRESPNEIIEKSDDEITITGTMIDEVPEITKEQFESLKNRISPNFGPTQY